MSAYACYPSLQDRCVRVTGGASGVGVALVEQFARQGARIGFMTSTSRRARLRLAADARHVPVFVHADLTDVGALDARAGSA